MSWQDFLHVGLWGFMDNLVVMNPPTSQCTLGWAFKNSKPMQAQRNHMVLQVTGENTVANATVQEATMGTWLNNSDHLHFTDLGTLWTDLDILETKMNNKPSLQGYDSYLEVLPQ